MLLITVTRISTGYRLLATSTYRARYYCWSLYRNGTLLSVISRNYHGEKCVNFDLNMPLAPGHYELRVECFAWNSTGMADGTGYQMDVATVTTIG